MKKKWYIVNEKFFELERQKKKVEGTDKWSEWVTEWNNLVEMSQKIAGCVNREKYEENIGETEGEVRTEESNN